jgi:hypothetical protein
MAHVRAGFARDEIDAPYQVAVADEEEFSSFRDEEAGTILLNSDPPVYEHKVHYLEGNAVGLSLCWRARHPAGSTAGATASRQ